MMYCKKKYNISYCIVRKIQSPYFSQSQYSLITVGARILNVSKENSGPLKEHYTLYHLLRIYISETSI